MSVMLWLVSVRSFLAASNFCRLMYSAGVMPTSFLNLTLKKEREYPAMSASSES